MTDGKRSTQALGLRGEEIACAYLKGQKFTIVERNFRCKGGELDIIARDGKTLVFVEVKARRTLSFGPPQMAVTPFKQRQISKAALTWLARKIDVGPARRAICWNLCVYDAIALAATLVFLLSGMLNPLGWGIAAVYLFFTLGFGYFLIPQKKAA